MTNEQLLRTLVTVNILNLNTLYEIREILGMQHKVSPDAYSSPVENTAEYSKTRQEMIMALLGED